MLLILHCVWLIDWLICPAHLEAINRFFKKTKTCGSIFYSLSSWSFSVNFSFCSTWSQGVEQIDHSINQSLNHKCNRQWSIRNVSTSLPSSLLLCTLSPLPAWPTAVGDRSWRPNRCRRTSAGTSAADWPARTAVGPRAGTAAAAAGSAESAHRDWFATGRWTAWNLSGKNTRKKPYKRK